MHLKLVKYFPDKTIQNYRKSEVKSIMIHSKNVLLVKNQPR